MFHKEGHKIIIYSFFITFIISISSEYFLINDYFSKITQIFSLVIFCLILQFFRNPKRNVKLNDKSILAPADGKIVIIKEVFEKEFYKEKRLQVSIFMSPLNVHANYYPISGNVSYVRYHPGLFLVAWHPKSSTKNERSTVVVKDAKNREVLFRQIAGSLARRICLYAEVDNTANAGSEFGFIKFGSRVDVFLPLGTEINVELNQKVKGRLTRIATLK